jgi:hypothetical protein
LANPTAYQINDNDNNLIEMGKYGNVSHPVMIGFWQNDDEEIYIQLDCFYDNKSLVIYDVTHNPINYRSLRKVLRYLNNAVRNHDMCLTSFYEQSEPEEKRFWSKMKKLGYVEW